MSNNQFIQLYRECVKRRVIFLLAIMDVVVEKKFPSENLVPKNETGVLNFLKKYPTYNGEGVTIAIFDSGVDPKSAGLQV